MLQILTLTVKCSKRIRSSYVYFFQTCNTPDLKLTLENTYFTNNTVTKGWLSGLSKDVDELTISSEFLSEIGESAFSGPPFGSLKQLVIKDSRLKMLKRQAVNNTKLETLEIRCIDAITPEFDALGPIADFLIVLQLNGCIDTIQSIINITGPGTSVFNKLLQFDLRYNSFNQVLNHSFAGLSTIVALYLSNNNIDYMEVDAFKDIRSSLQLLDISNNKLSTLPEGIFGGFYHVGEIDISNNRWNCNCSLVWLKDFYIKNLESYFRNGTIQFQCTQGKYSDVDFCPSTPSGHNITSTTEISFITITEKYLTTADTTTTSDDSDNYVYLDCKDLTLQDTSLEGKNMIYSHSVKVRNGTITYNFYQIEDTPNYEIKVVNTIGSDYVVWINTKNSTDYGCVHNVQEIIQLSNLQYDNTYTLCLLKESSDTVTPFDCTSLSVPPEWKNLAWIKNKYIPIVIGAVAGATVAIVLTTSLIIFYTIRQHPKLIKGNKRVVIVRNKSADALVMPNYDRQPYIPPSITTNSEGYLTPRHKMYTRVNERRFRPLNTITENFYRDMLYNRSMGSYQEQMFHRRAAGNGVYEAPPLPPNHPSDRLKNSPRPRSSLYNVNTISILFGSSVMNPLDARSLSPRPLVSDRGTGIDTRNTKKRDDHRASVQYEKANAYCYCLPLHNYEKEWANPIDMMCGV
ncbi:hypothetical protein NQ318_000307 [Aromia moschata]|uniref:Uncharacterized protein n=1 Tax=Aromia moschata TaxID=1265417 RepID=A0AAV8YX58_9CUCU|nr:hypothetical protein NQ318_000307 [Aromia moschata]